MDYNAFFKSKAFKIVTCAVGSLLVLCLVFAAGVSVGFHKARFSYQWGENYHKNFGGPREGFMERGPMKGFDGRDLINGHGTAGQIMRIDGQSIVMKGNDGVEEIVITTEKTSIRIGRTDVKLDSLKANDSIVVIGEPNTSGQIEAKLIRVMPTPPQAGMNQPPMMPNQPK